MKQGIRNVGRFLSRTFLQGLAIVLPVSLTIAVLFWFATATESVLGGLIEPLLFPDGGYWPGLGTLLALLIIFAAGLLLNALIARRVVAGMDALLERIPVVKSIYTSIRDIANFLSKANSKSNYRQVVAVRFSGMRLIGFVTAEDFAGLPQTGKDKDIIGVYLPMSYGIGGYTVYLPKSEVEPLDMSIEEAMRVTLLAGMSGKKQETPAAPGSDTKPAS